jgi:hypothetical protein
MSYICLVIKIKNMAELMNKERASKIFDILVELGGARESDKPDFIYSHCDYEYGCREWRFCGHFGFGGKYRSSSNTVTFYSEDSTDKRIKLRDEINNKLKEI